MCTKDFLVPAYQRQAQKYYIINVHHNKNWETTQVPLNGPDI